MTYPAPPQGPLRVLGTRSAEARGHAGTPGLLGDWEAAYRENLTWVYRFAYGRVGNQADAEDITAEVFSRALPRLRLAAPPEQLRAYLVATARTVLADYWQRYYDYEMRVSDDVAAAEPMADVQSSADNARRADRLLALLPDHYRRVLELRFLRGFSVRDTARALSISIANAKVLQHRALRRAAELGEEVLR